MYIYTRNIYVDVIYTVHYLWGFLWFTIKVRQLKKNQ